MSGEALIHFACWVPLPLRADTTVSNKPKNVEVDRLLCHLNTISEQIDVE